MSKSFFGHPIGLSTLFATEFWERFSYYGMRALLVLYLTSSLIEGGFGLSRQQSLHIYGIFTGLVYLTPLLGGLLADNLWGHRKAVYIGALVIAAGQFTLALSSIYADQSIEIRQFLLFSGLGLLIAGNGLFKPNISTMVGSLYGNNDARRDGGFTIFYMGINAGAFFAPLIAGSLGENIAWHYGFMSAGVGMIISTLWLYLRHETLGQIGMPPNTPQGQIKLKSKDAIQIAIYSVVSVVVVLLSVFFINVTPSMILNIIMYVILALFLSYVGYQIVKNTITKDEWSRIAVIFILAILTIVFWSGFEQAGGTFNMFARDITDRTVNSFVIPTSWFQAINPLAIFILGPLFSLLWIKLASKNKEPNTPTKFAFGLLFLSFGFWILVLANHNRDTNLLLSPLWLVSVYLIHTIGELCLSPIGLSMVTKLSPTKIVSVMMGVWFAASAVGNYLSGAMESIVAKFDFEVFTFLAVQSLIAAAVAFALAPWLNKMMKGVK